MLVVMLVVVLFVMPVVVLFVCVCVHHGVYRHDFVGDVIFSRCCGACRSSPARQGSGGSGWTLAGTVDDVSALKMLQNECESSGVSVLPHTDVTGTSDL